MLGQSLGSVVVGLEALLRLRPTVLVESMGYAFTYPAWALVGVPIAAYVHYPTISEDMLARVGEQRATYNNAGVVATRRELTQAKLLYYRLFARLYRLVAWPARVVMANSSWTAGHLRSVWQRTPVLVYPPCPTADLQALPLARPPAPLLLSVGQFRPEKAHDLQLEVLARVRAACPAIPARLALVGGARDEADRGRVAELKARAAALGLADAVEFHVDAKQADVRALLGTAAVGLHTMWNEHFGISVVELMASGVVPVAHNSGGPRLDIVREDEAAGLLATTADEYAAAVLRLLRDPALRSRMQAGARARAASFSDERFAQEFLAAFARTSPEVAN